MDLAAFVPICTTRMICVACQTNATLMLRGIELSAESVVFWLVVATSVIRDFSKPVTVASALEEALSVSGTESESF